SDFEDIGKGAETADAEAKGRAGVGASCGGGQLGQPFLAPVLPVIAGDEAGEKGDPAGARRARWRRGSHAGLGWGGRFTAPRPSAGKRARAVASHAFPAPVTS